MAKKKTAKPYKQNLYAAVVFENATFTAKSCRTSLERLQMQTIGLELPPDRNLAAAIAAINRYMTNCVDIAADHRSDV